MKRYIVEGYDFDGIYAYYVVDTNHPLYNLGGRQTNQGSDLSFGLSKSKSEMQ